MSKYDVLCIGNAIVDIIAQADEKFLVDNGIIKGAMNLIDMERAVDLYSKMGPAIEASGGSAGNTAAGIASFGGAPPISARSPTTSWATSSHMTSRRSASPSTRSRLQAPPPTARSMIFVTPDGERSMNTYLGACVELTGGCRGGQGAGLPGHLFRGLPLGSAAAKDASA